MWLLCVNCLRQGRVLYATCPEGLAGRAPLVQHCTSQRFKKSGVWREDVPVSASVSECLSLHLCHHEFVDGCHQLVYLYLCHDWFGLKCHTCKVNEKPEL